MALNKPLGYIKCRTYLINGSSNNNDHYILYSINYRKVMVESDTNEEVLADESRIRYCQWEVNRREKM